MLIIVIGPAGSLSPVVTRKMFIADSSAVYLSRDRLSHRMVRRSLLAEATAFETRQIISLSASLFDFGRCSLHHPIVETCGRSI